MSNCIDYGCDALGQHAASIDCGAITKGGSSSWVVFACGATTTNPSNASQINADISAGRAVVVTNVKSGFAKPSPVTTDSINSCGTPSVITNDWTGTLTDGNISDQNIDFWNAFIAGRQAASVLMIHCVDESDTPYATWINPSSGIKFSGGRVVPNVSTQPQLIDVDFKWRQLKSPQVYSAPVGVTGL